MNAHAVFWVLIALGAVWTAAWAFVLVRSRPGPAFEEIEPTENRLRRRLLVVFAVVFLAAFVLLLPAYPYVAFRTRGLGVPVDSVSVMAVQWNWSIVPDTIPRGLPVAFLVQSKDVNHDFAVYAADGRLVTQVQAMPGYTNQLIYQFNEPGTYTVRCLEYCGIFHPIMLASFVVK